MHNPANQAIMIWLAYFIYGFIIMRFLVSIINLLTGQWLKTAVKGFPGHSPLISVLIPARNEESTIGLLLSDLLQQDYANLEVLVFDDLSTDNTLQVVKEFTLKDPRIKLMKGLPLPEGWLGKNHACHRLSGKAEGEYLIFMDADVRLKKSLLTNSLAHAVRHKLDMMSIFPVQKMYTFGEKITVPIMNWVLAGLLPLILTRISSWPSFSAANGQFMLFRAVTYHNYKFHKQLKHDMAEDIAIFREMKKSGLRTHTVLSNGDISCRMYKSWSESIEGFAKNVIDFFGGYAFMAILFAVLTGLGFIPVILALPWNFVIAFFGVSILTRTVISLISRQSPVNNIIFAPLQHISLFIMIIKALIHKKQHSLKWKGRKVYLIVLIIALINFNINARAQSEDPTEMIYSAFVEEKMNLWARAIAILEKEYKQSGSIDILYELTLARYGYIGYNLGTDNEEPARENISLAEEQIDKLTNSHAYESSAYALQAAFYAYRISMAPWRAVFWGRKSMNLIDKAIETDPQNPSGWIEHGNAMFYAPPVVGGSKKEAIKSYSMAIQLLEADMKKVHRWLYLNTLVGLAKSYRETDNRPMAVITLRKALEFEPEFKWVKDRLLPEFLEK